MSSRMYVALVFYLVASVFNIPGAVSQVVLCDIAGCVNGVCLQPPVVSQPVCNCSTGFRSYANPNVCEDVNECALDPYRCGYSAYSGYRSWSIVPSGRCVNRPGSYTCYCYPPNIPVNGGRGCISLPRQRSTLCNKFAQYRLLEEL